MDLASLLLSLLLGQATAPPAEPALKPGYDAVSTAPFIRPLWPPLGG